MFIDPEHISLFAIGVAVGFAMDAVLRRLVDTVYPHRRRPGLYPGRRRDD